MKMAHHTRPHPPCSGPTFTRRSTTYASPIASDSPMNCAHVEIDDGRINGFRY